MAHALYGVLSRGSSRADDWRACFGGMVVPLLCAEPIGAGDELMLFVDVKQLEPDERRRVSAFCARKYNLPELEVERRFARSSLLPIVADGITVVVHQPGRYLA